MLREWRDLCRALENFGRATKQFLVVAQLRHYLQYIELGRYIEKLSLINDRQS